MRFEDSNARGHVSLPDLAEGTNSESNECSILDSPAPKNQKAKAWTSKATSDQAESSQKFSPKSRSRNIAKDVPESLGLQTPTKKIDTGKVINLSLKTIKSYWEAQFFAGKPMTCEYVEKFSIKPPQPPAKNKGTLKKNSTHKKKIPNEVFKATLPRNFDASQKKRKQPSIEDLGTPPPMSTEPSPRRKKSGTPKFEASKWQEAQNGPKPFTAEIDSDVELEDQVPIALRTVIQMKKAKELHTMQQAIELAKKHAEEETARRGSAPMSDEELVAKLARK